MTSGTPGTTPRPFMIAASVGRRKPPFAGWNAKTFGAPRARRCWKTARWIAASGRFMRLLVAIAPSVVGIHLGEIVALRIEQHKPICFPWRLRAWHLDI